MDTSLFEAGADQVDHGRPIRTAARAGWHWVVECEHLVDPLPLEHYAVEDGWIRSLAYNRVTQCLEVRFKWKTVHELTSN